MKRIFIPFGILVMLVWFVSCSTEKPVDVASPDAPDLAKGSAQSYTDFDGASAPGITKRIGPPLQPKTTGKGGLTFFITRKAFDKQCSNLREATFEHSNLPPNSVGACIGLFNSFTNNACYSPGAIPPNIDLRALGNNQMVVLTTGFLGVPSTVVGPNFFTDDLFMRFKRNKVDAVGMDLYDPFGPAVLDISIFDTAGNLLGGAVVGTGTTIPTFFGVVSNQPIGAIIFDQVAGGGGELVDNVEFGLCDDD